MKFSKRSLVVGLGTLGFLGCGGADWDQAGQGLETADESAELAAAPSKSFLSLGNSIAFGFSPLVAPVPSNYIGYPEVIAARGHKVTNASCPGETSSSFFSTTAPDNGCRGFKAAYALHADYETTQSVFMVDAIMAKGTPFNWITLDIGANDLFLLQKTCANDLACIQAGMPGLLSTYANNLTTGYNQVKAAGYKGKFVGLTTYAPNYNDPVAVGALNAINATLDSFTQQIGGKLADGFKEFQTRAAASGGDSCAAGLLIKLPNGTCDIHPSQTGREVLADAVLNAVQ
jgi:lysophospholipase L1-like esterase